MLKFWIVCAVSGMLNAFGQAVELPLKSPLAASTPVTCSQRPGVRATRSEVVQFGGVTASLSSQASREGGTCVKSTALWVTQNGVSQQFDLPDAGMGTFGIVDIAPDASSILLTSGSGESSGPSQMAIVPLKEGAFKWITISDMAGLRDCDSFFEVEGFSDANRVIIASLPPRSPHPLRSCITYPAYLSYDVRSHSLKPASTPNVKQSAQAVSGPMQSCKTDPDVIAACYTTRARLELSPKGDGLLLWPVGSTHLLMAEDSMVPSELRARVTPNMRVYATMLICPLNVEQRGPRPHVCVDSARDFKANPFLKKTSLKKMGGRQF